MAKVKLAGFNVDADQLKLVLAGEQNKSALTPESISAGYARISRSEKDVGDLRRAAAEDIKKARASNTKIVFKMGHHSVAEHAVFNFDITGISRLGLEWVESFRLNSMTEKSQRYVTLRGDLVTPAELLEKEKELYQRIARKVQNKFYFKALPILIRYQQEKNPDEKNEKLIEDWAKEDARFVLCLGTSGQVGMTINTRNLEYMIRRAPVSPHYEILDLGEQFNRIGHKVTPSLIMFTEPNDYMMYGDSELEAFLESDEKIKSGIQTAKEVDYGFRNKGEVKLVDYTRDGDDKIIAALIRSGTGLPFERAYFAATHLSNEKKLDMLKARFKGIEMWDAMPREFEMVDLTFEADISASNFAQLKRHRMATLLPGAYDLSLGVTVPESIKATNLEKEFMEVIDMTNEAYSELKKTQPNACNYLLTNAHQRTVLMKMNLRELYHFSRLREDEHAQWDIQNLAKSVVKQAKEAMPISTCLIGGKHEFESIKNKVYNPE